MPTAPAAARTIKGRQQLSAALIMSVRIHTITFSSFITRIHASSGVEADRPSSECCPSYRLNRRPLKPKKCPSRHPGYPSAARFKQVSEIVTVRKRRKRNARITCDGSAAGLPEGTLPATMLSPQIVPAPCAHILVFP